MKVLALAAVFFACLVGASACGGGSYECKHGDCNSALARAPLTPTLRDFVYVTLTSVPLDGGYYELDVYGPGSRRRLVKASSGDRVHESPRQAKERFYSIVLHGQFSNCRSCNHPAGRIPGMGRSRPASGRRAREPPTSG